MFWDLAQAHVNAVVDFDQAFLRAGSPESNYLVINLGTGKGVTVLELVQAFERVYGQEINKRSAPPRPGDVAGSYANADKAWEYLGWRAELDIDQGIKDALQWGEIRHTILDFSSE